MPVLISLDTHTFSAQGASYIPSPPLDPIPFPKPPRKNPHPANFHLLALWRAIYPIALAGEQTAWVSKTRVHE